MRPSSGRCWPGGGFVLLSWQHSFAGDDDSADVNLAAFQPCAFYQLGGGTYLRAAPIWTYNLENDDYSVPLGVGLGQVIKRGKTVFNVFVEPQFSVADRGAGRVLRQCVPERLQGTVYRMILLDALITVGVAVINIPADGDRRHGGSGAGRADAGAAVHRAGAVSSLHGVRPRAPSPTAGAPYFIAVPQAQPVAIPVAEAIDCPTRLGNGSHLLLSQLTGHRSPSGSERKVSGT